VHRHAPVHNAREAAEAGLEFDQALLIKTLVYAAADGWLLVAMRALDRLDHGALARAAGIDRRKLRFATDEDLERSFGWQAGGAAPVPVIEGVRLIVDQAVLELPLVFFGSGRRDLTIEAQPGALFGGASYTVAALTK
jgi:prolyl-tRNA editing enzyme YbaK/EbsC (Cys-tRNA(Pro) deacylase)